MFNVVSFSKQQFVFDTPVICVILGKTQKFKHVTWATETELWTTKIKD